MDIRFLIHKLYEIGAVKFGTFTLKSGIVSPIYFDLRLTISYPKLLVSIAEALHEKVRHAHFDLICGVPYTALPFATAISIQHNIPMVLRRKEKKEHGTGKLIEGVYQKNERCLIIEDVITSGQSIFETIVPLTQEGLIVKDVAVLVDREQGGKRYIEAKGLHVHPVCTITQIVEELVREGKITPKTASSVQQFIKANQVNNSH